MGIARAPVGECRGRGRRERPHVSVRRSPPARCRRCECPSSCATSMVDLDPGVPHGAGSWSRHSPASRAGSRAARLSNRGVDKDAARNVPLAGSSERMPEGKVIWGLGGRLWSGGAGALPSRRRPSPSAATHLAIVVRGCLRREIRPARCPPTSCGPPRASRVSERRLAEAYALRQCDEQIAQRSACPSRG